MAVVKQGTVLKRPVARSGTGLAWREAMWGLIFIGPWVVGFLVFTLFPMLASLYLSFTDFEILHPEDIDWIGVRNYARMLGDAAMWHSLGITVWYAVLSVPTGLILTIGIAALVNAKRLWFKRLFRTLFFMPSIIPAVAATLIWAGVLNGQTGWINRALAAVGISGPNWVLDTTWVYPALVFMGLWGIGGGMIITLAALQSVPSELYDAARVDGAGPVRRFFSITLPMITPVIFYLLVVSLIGVSQYFTQPFVLSNGTGRPDDATMFFNIFLYKEAFTFQQMGYASALGWLMFIIVLVVTAVLFGTAKYWVYYAGGEE